MPLPDFIPDAEGYVPLSNTTISFNHLSFSLLVTPLLFFDNSHFMVTPLLIESH